MVEPQLRRGDEGLRPPSRGRFHALSPSAFWALLGAAALVFQAVVFTRWIIGDGVRAVPRDYEIATVDKVRTWVVQAAIVVVFALLLTYFVKASRRADGPTFPALMFAGFGATFWQDPIINYGAVRIAYNRYSINVASWGEYIPGWQSPGSDRQVESLIAGAGIAYTFVILWVLGTLAVLNRIARRHKRGFGAWSLSRVVLTTLVLGITADLLIENVWIRFGGGWSFAEVNAEYAFSGGHWYQIPYAEPAMVSTYVVLPTVLLIWRAKRRDEQVWVWKGTEHLVGSRQSVIRLLATVGLANLMIFAILVSATLLYGSGGFPADSPAHLR